MLFNSEIRSFSSYTKGLHAVSALSFEEEFIKLTLLLPASFKAKLEKRYEKYKCSALSVDGVYAKICFAKSIQAEGLEYFEVVAQLAKEAFFNTTLTKINSVHKVNIGMLSTNPQKWLLDSSPLEKVKLIKSQIAKDHCYTKELTFECSKLLFDRLEKLSYIGLNGSGLTIKDSYHLNGRYYFLIHIGKQTRETTLLGNDSMVGKEFTLTLPFVASSIKEGKH